MFFHIKDTFLKRLWWKKHWKCRVTFLGHKILAFCIGSSSRPTTHIFWLWQPLNWALEFTGKSDPYPISVHQLVLVTSSLARDYSAVTRKWNHGMEPVHLAKIWVFGLAQVLLKMMRRGRVIKILWPHCCGAAMSFYAVYRLNNHLCYTLRLLHKGIFIKWVQNRTTLQSLPLLFSKLYNPHNS